MIVQVHVQPAASRSEIAGLHGASLKVRIQAPPVDDRANEALVELLAMHFKVPKRAVRLLSGHQARCKRFSIEGSPVFPESLLAAAEPGSNP